MAGELGRASLDLSANLGEFRRNIEEGRRVSGRMEHSLEAVAAIAKIAEHELGRVKMEAGQGAESRAVADRIAGSAGRVGRAAMEAAEHLENVKLGMSQAIESDAAGDVIDRKLKSINRNANETRRALDRVKIAGGVPGRSGVGVGPFGSGFGRLGFLGAAIGAGALTAPAAAPAVGGLLAAIPALSATAVGALGTLVLAFQGVSKAIEGDKKAFDELQPSQQKFVLTIRSLIPWIDKLKSVAGNALFPGLTGGLTAALSPGTVGAITRAVQQFGQAIGAVGLQWGKYFGSGEFQSIFGPLMQSGARNLGVLADAALHLFDALGVVGRAAIPLTNWLVTAADRGAKLASSWIHAKDASGGLARGMREAQSSLRLVGGLFVSLGRVVGALGRALYPVSKVAVKELTNGLNGLARTINRNQTMIREVVGGALKAFVSIIKVAVAVLGPLLKGLNAGAHAIGGWKNAWLALFAIGIASKLRGIARAMFVLEAAAGTKGATGAVKGLEAAAGAQGAAGGIRALRLSLIGKAGLVGAVGAASFALTTMILKLTGLDSKLRSTGSAAYDFLTKHAHIPGVHDPMAQFDGKVIPSQRQSLAVIAAARKLKAAGYTKAQIEGQFAKWHPDWATHDIDVLVAAAFRKRSKPFADTADASRGADVGNTNPVTSAASSTDSPFGTPPPFDKNVPKPRKKPAPPVIPALASRAEALASSNASRASTLHNLGQTAKRYLENELRDLTVADRVLHEAYVKASGKARTRLFAEITRVENRQRRVRDQIKHALKKAHDDELQFAVDQAKLAVEKATVGTAAYDRAVKAEERALKAQIAYLDKIAHNRKLSLNVRERALRKERADEKQLKTLLKKDRGGSGDFAAARDQFLRDFANINQTYAPNSQPNTAKTDTHLYEAVHELRQQTKHLLTLISRASFPASSFDLEATQAVFG